MFCVLGDCSKAACHNCFPVKFCKYEHNICKLSGTCCDIDSQKNDVMVTGCAGFIGYHVCIDLLDDGFNVTGIDNINDYYDTQIKEKNIKCLLKYKKFTFIKEDIVNTTAIARIKPKTIIHLASMAGVRYSIEQPQTYIDNNISGFVNILEQAKTYNLERLVYASSSSVYGLNDKVPFSEEDPIEKCNSPYACSKYAMEIFARSYAQLYNMKLVGLRFFTVYGPHGRPDMAPYKFLKAIKNGDPIEKYGDGTSSRDYTYIDDIVNGITSATFSENIVSPIYNLGNSTPVSLNAFIETCEIVCGRLANINRKPMPIGDVPHTYANITKAINELSYTPKTSLLDGLTKMHQWMVDEDI